MRKQRRQRYTGPLRDALLHKRVAAAVTRAASKYTAECFAQVNDRLTRIAGAFAPENKFPTA